MKELKSNYESFPTENRLKRFRSLCLYMYCISCVKTDIRN
jgi:hypothetical protein